MKMTGMSDQEIIDTIVREQGVVALATPPIGTVGGIISWVMPGVALILGFWIYSAYVKRNRKAPEIMLDPEETNILHAHQREIDRELDESPDARR
jgi:cytochrome c-type biogenesis protein CcmH